MVATAEMAATNWAAGMGSASAVTKYKQKIQAVSESPMAKAASPAAQQKYLNRTQLAVSSGRMAQRLNAVSLSAWQSQAINIGAMNLANGARKGQAKYSAAAQKLQSLWQQQHSAAQAIPHDGSLGSAMARVQAVVQLAMQYAGRA
jgi:hypothetical protein